MAAATAAVASLSVDADFLMTPNILTACRSCCVLARPPSLPDAASVHALCRHRVSQSELDIPLPWQSKPSRGS